MLFASIFKQKERVPNLPKIKNYNKNRVLIANSVAAFQNSAALEGFLGEALDARGWEVGYAFCDGNLVSCLNTKYSNLVREDDLYSGQWKKSNSACKRCAINQKRFFKSNAKFFYFSAYENQKDSSEITAAINGNSNPKEWSFMGIDIYEHAFSATARFYAKGMPEDEHNFQKTLRMFAHAAVSSVQAYQAIIDEFKPDLIIGHHGIYVPQGPMVDVAKKNQIRLITWTPSYRRGTFTFVEGDTYHKVMPKMSLRPEPLTPKQSSMVLSYLKSRREGADDWIWYHKNESSRTCTYENFSIPKEKKLVTAFTNVFWDAQLHFAENAFESMLHWIDETIDYFEVRNDTHLIIRVHPAEKSGFVPTRQPLDQLYKDRLMNADSITLIAAEDDYSSYDLASDSNFCIVYGSKLAAELSGLGKRVIIAGEAWARSKGFTDDAESPAHYQSLLKKNLRLKGNLESKRHEKALRYCYQFFFEDMQTIELARPTGDRFRPFDFGHYTPTELSRTDHSSFEKIMAFITGARSAKDRTVDRIGNIFRNLPNFETEALKSKLDMNKATDVVRSLGLEPHHDHQKNWDTLKALSGILENCADEKNMTVLDIGTGSKPTILNWLRTIFPTANLYGCDRDAKLSRNYSNKNIKFTPLDITAANYEDEFFDFITSISVIEHGVDTKAFFCEISKKLKKGGFAFVSTDYWEQTIDTSEKFPYGVDYGAMKVFTKTELLSLIATANLNGLDLIGSLENLDCNEKAVYWERMDESYTFAFLAFVKK